PRARCALFRGDQRVEPAGGRERSRSLLLVARPGLRVQGGPQRDQSAACEGADRVGGEVRSEGVQRCRRARRQRAARRAGDECRFLHWEHEDMMIRTLALLLVPTIATAQRPTLSPSVKQYVAV